MDNPRPPCRCEPPCPSYRDHLLSINIGSSALPTRRRHVNQTAQTETGWDKDMPAYKRLRANGLQPQSIDGAAELETRATDRFEVEMGHLFEGKQKAEAREFMALSNELTAHVAESKK